MKKFIKNLWYGEPVQVFAILAAVSTAVVGVVHNPIVTAVAVGIQGIGGAYGVRKLTTPEFVERLPDMEGPE